jgi:hypothetical protein
MRRQCSEFDATCLKDIHPPDYFRNLLQVELESNNRDLLREDFSYVNGIRKRRKTTEKECVEERRAKISYRD